MPSPSTAPPVLRPIQQTPIIALPSTGTLGEVATYTPYGMYADPASILYSAEFVSGAVDQVKYTYNKLGGNVLDIELETRNIYSSYEEAVLEYSYLVNMHQAENALSSLLGQTTGTFDHNGNIVSGTLSGSNVALKFPRFFFGYADRASQGFGQRASVGGTQTEYSASFNTQTNVQDYDLQEIISNSAEFSGTVGNKQILITKVFYETPRAAWRFYGYYGGLTTVGNYHNYGQWADDSTFEVIPVYHNKLQAIQYENALYTRLSHWSYEIRNNKLRIYPLPQKNLGPNKMWVRFYVPLDAWEEEGDTNSGINGVNNVNTLPFANLPYDNINSMGKEWIRDYALALSMETLGHIRSKLGSIPIPNGSVNLNGPELVSRAVDEQNRLRDQLNEYLQNLTYAEMTTRDAQIAEDAKKIQENVPRPIYVG